MQRQTPAKNNPSSSPQEGWAGGQANEVSAQEKNHNHYCRKNNKTLRKSVLFCPLRLYKPINKILNKAHS